MHHLINWVIALIERLFKRKNKYVNYIRGNETLPEPLSKDEEFNVLTRFQGGDERARQTSSNIIAFGCLYCEEI